MSDFKKLLVWQKAHVMSLNAHRFAGRIRRADNLALRSQIIRAAASIPTNIVEGCNQETVPQYKRFLRIALNSSSELEYHLLVARDLKLVQTSDAMSLMSQVIEVRKMLFGLINSLASRPERSPEAKLTPHAST